MRCEVTCIRRYISTVPIKLLSEGVDTTEKSFFLFFFLFKMLIAISFFIRLITAFRLNSAIFRKYDLNCTKRFDQYRLNQNYEKTQRNSSSPLITFRCANRVSECTLAVFFYPPWKDIDEVLMGVLWDF